MFQSSTFQTLILVSDFQFSRVTHYPEFQFSRVPLLRIPVSRILVSKDVLCGAIRFESPTSPSLFFFSLFQYCCFRYFNVWDSDWLGRFLINVYNEAPRLLTRPYGLPVSILPNLYLMRVFLGHFLHVAPRADRLLFQVLSVTDYKYLGWGASTAHQFLVRIFGTSCSNHSCCVLQWTKKNYSMVW